MAEPWCKSERSDCRVHTLSLHTQLQNSSLVKFDSVHPPASPWEAEHNWTKMIMRSVLPSHSGLGIALKAHFTFQVSSFVNYFIASLSSNLSCHFSTLHSAEDLFPISLRRNNQQRTSTCSHQHVYCSACIGSHGRCLTFYRGWMSILLSKSNSFLLCTAPHFLTFSRIGFFFFQIYPLYFINFPTYEVIPISI